MRSPCVAVCKAKTGIWALAHRSTRPHFQKGGEVLQGTSLDVVLFIMMYGAAKVCFGIADIIRAVRGEPTAPQRKDDK